MKDTDEDQTSKVIARYTLDVNDDKLTQSILACLGSRVEISINNNNSLVYDFPESKCDLIIQGDGLWAPVTGAFTDEGHLYLFVGFGSQGEFLYSPSGPNRYRGVPYGYDPEPDGTKHEFFVNPLFDDEIARILPVEDVYVPV